MRRLIAHLRGKAPEQIRLSTSDDFKVNERCRTCHRQEWAAWSASLHNATYKEIFLDPKHNRQRMLTDDCLRCHGMHFDGGIRALVNPVDTAGPWRLLRNDMADRPVILCLSCHQMHRHGIPLARPAVKQTTSAAEKIHVSSAALFDRRELVHVPIDQLPLPEMREGVRRVRTSPDQRQALCYQCHAPLASAEVASGDDRTPIGVHEGLSCFSCHENHGGSTRASCATCHPRLSNCGIDVETMDTTFKSTNSPHNVHFVKCTDCHTKGIPHKRLTVSGVGP
ncbi:MAG: multiheme c-type cytochrome [Deltaproteobacteria bacterium]